MTPLMQQYHAIKIRYTSSLVMFQVGDFYELFYDDAKKASAFLGITLTKRGKSEGEPIPLCGVPCHALEHYLIKLVQGGFSVVICDQQSEPEPGKLVERSVSQVFTPGTLHSEALLDPRIATVMGAVVLRENYFALVFFEVVTGRWQLAVIPAAQRPLVEAELVRYAPREILVSSGPESDAIASWFVSLGRLVTRFDADCALIKAEEYALWRRHALTDAAAQLYDRNAVVSAVVDMLYSYVMHHVPEGLRRIRPLTVYAPDEYLFLDSTTQRNLEIVVPLHETGVTLLTMLDYGVTAMGTRLIRSWLLRPLRHRYAIEQRLSAVAALVNNHRARDDIRQKLRVIGDIERVVGRIMLQRAALIDYLLLRNALSQIAPLTELLEAYGLRDLWHGVISVVPHLIMLQKALYAVIADEPGDAGTIRIGYHAELDAYRALARDGAAAIAAHEEEERRITGISSLKIRCQGHYGYAIEITKAHQASIPQHYRLVQSLVNRDRFITPALQELVVRLESAHVQVELLEQSLMATVKAEVYAQGDALRICADALATIDAYAAFAEAAVINRYVRPEFTDTRLCEISQGRHPVVEQLCSRSVGSFIANDLCLTAQERMWVITGPNMGGKSTFMRQVALIALMAQAGSFVPATYAKLPLFDRICTRIGASDNVAAGKSTFMLEMEEVARLCADATEHSLVILDELGRGTATYDGIALAQAVLEYIDTKLHCFALCATHYHELAGRVALPGRAIGAYHAVVHHTDRGPLVTYRVERGIAEGSFGIAVAQRAGLPESIISRARELLDIL